MILLKKATLSETLSKYLKVSYRVVEIFVETLITVSCISNRI